MLTSLDKDWVDYEVRITMCVFREDEGEQPRSVIDGPRLARSETNRGWTIVISGLKGVIEGVERGSVAI